MSLLATTDALHLSASRFLLISLAALAVLMVVGCALMIRRAKMQRQSSAPGRPLSLPASLVYAAFILSVVALSFTSIFSIWRYQSMHGWWLVAHTVAAGVFVFSVTVMALFLSRRFVEKTSAAVALLYGLMLVASIAVIGTILLSMYPLFGTPEMLRLIEVHRYGGLVLLAATVLHGLLFPLER